jgi:aminoglycoside phosphotransferase (APT) family kinase protein
VPVASPCRFEPDPSYLGTPFAVMPFVAGAIPSDFTPADPWLTALATDADRRAVWEAFVDVLVAIHRTPTGGLGLREGLTAELHHWEQYLAWSEGAAVPALVDVVEWCRANAPSDPPPSGLLWGDVRLGNVVFDEATLQPAAVLDWDMASAGPFELDLAWFLALEDVQRELTGMVVSGFGTREDAIERAEHGLGRRLRDLAWYEVFALARASAISTRIATLQLRGGGRSMFRIGEDPALAAAQTAIARA